MSDSRILRTGVNCWRIERAHRFAPIVDAATYFGLARAAMLRARHRIMMIGWDFDTRVVLDPWAGGAASTESLGALVSALARERAGLHVFILQWRSGLLGTLVRGRTPLVVVRWKMHRRVHVRLAADHPAGACHHQKILVIDDALAFCGGIDMTAGRWDTRAHRDDEPLRARPAGRSYAPLHDVTTALDGPAARALGDFARERWRRATGEVIAPVPRGADPWPDGLAPLVREVDIAVARTEPAYRDRAEVREIEALYLSAIGAARRSIYLESQYFVSRRIAEALARRLGEPDGPEAVVINPVRADGWLQEAAMGSARALWLARIALADSHRRFRMYTPVTATGRPIYVHAKVMVIDDRLLRVGSSNLNNRSMGFDTECDVALEARGSAFEDREVRRSIAMLRDSLVAEHLGVPLEVFTAAVEECGSLIGAIERLRADGGPTLVPFSAPPLSESAARIADHEHLDPERPQGLGRELAHLLRDLRE